MYVSRYSRLTWLVENRPVFVGLKKVEELEVGRPLGDTALLHQSNELIGLDAVTCLGGFDGFLVVD